MDGRRLNWVSLIVYGCNRWDDNNMKDERDNGVFTM